MPIPITFLMLHMFAHWKVSCVNSYLEAENILLYHWLRQNYVNITHSLSRMSQNQKLASACLRYDMKKGTFNWNWIVANPVTMKDLTAKQIATDLNKENESKRMELHKS